MTSGIPVTTRLGVVSRVRPDGAHKYLELDSGATLIAPRYVVAAKGDVLFRDGRGIFLRLKNGSARILPAYRSSRLLKVGARQYRVVVQTADWLGLLGSEGRCVYDPVCADKGGSCHACAHLPETSCRFFNLNLSRSFVFGGHDSILGALNVGYFDRRLD